MPVETALSQFKPQLVLIDLDGTLIDSVPDLAFCIDETMQRCNLPVRGENAVRNWVGNGVEKLVQRALANDMEGSPSAELLARALPIFMAVYQDNVSKRSRLYPGVIEGLEYLAAMPGLQVGCVTNKAETFTRPLLESLGILDYFAVVISGDTLSEKKPHPLPLLHAARVLGVKPEVSIMLGDSKSDVKAARAAGFKIICTSYGYNHGEDIRDYAPDAVIDSMAELETVLAAT